MKDIEQVFYSYVEGSDILYWWMKDIEEDFNHGKKVNKTKYNKIRRVEEKQRQEAIRLLEIMNKGSRVQTCMPPRIPPYLRR